MAGSFDSRGQERRWSAERVLDFRPRASETYSQRWWFLWPVKVWKAAFPKEEESSVNLLQRLILRFVAAGKRSSEEIAPKVALSEKLIQHCFQELIGMGCLTKDRQIEHRGQKLLEGRDEALHTIRVGWFFQDPWTGRLAPFVALPPVEFAEVEEREGKAFVRSGNKGSPREDSVWVIQSPRCEFPRPDVIDFVEAVEKHQRRQKRNQSSSEEGSGSESKFGKLSFVEEEAQDFHLLTFLYQPERRVLGGWGVAEPFGGRDAGPFRKLVSEREKDTRSVEALFQSAYGRGEYDQQKKLWDEEERELRAKAKRALSQEFPQRTRIEDQKVRESLEMAFEQFERLARVSEEERGRASSTQNLAWPGLRQAFEQGLGLVQESFPCAEAWRALYGERYPLGKDQAQAVLRSCVEKLGFQRPSPPKKPPFVGIKPEKIRSACQDAASLHLSGPRIGAFLLMAAEDPSHPFRMVAKEDPSWLEGADRLLSWAGAAIHASAKLPSYSDLLEAKILALRLLQTLLDAVERNVCVKKQR